MQYFMRKSFDKRGKRKEPPEDQGVKERLEEQLQKEGALILLNYPRTMISLKRKIVKDIFKGYLDEPQLLPETGNGLK